MCGNDQVFWGLVSVIIGLGLLVVDLLSRIRMHREHVRDLQEAHETMSALTTNEVVTMTIPDQRTINGQ